MKASVLSLQDIQAIHQATLQILDTTGIRISLPAARSLLLDAGCREREGYVCIPPELVTRCLDSCPPRFSLRGRGGSSLELGSGSLHWHNTGGAHTLYDPAADRFLPAGIEEVRNATRLLDALEGVDEVIPYFTPQDVPAPLVNLAMYRHALPFTTKPLAGPGLQTPEEAAYVYRMAEVIGQPAEMLSISVSPISPLYFPDEIAASILEVAKLGVAFWPLPAPSAGSTAPMTLAGALTLQNAEVLASIVLAQLVKPGLPITYCGRLSLLEPRTGGSTWGVPALGLAAAACVQIGHHYGLPVNVYGLASDSNQPDIQNGYERALNAILPALAGADELSGIGDMGAGLFTTYAQMVCDNDIVLGIKNLMRGIRVDENSLAADLVGQVMQAAGQGGGNFLAERHTVKTLRSGELFYPPLADRRLFDEWNRDGRVGMFERARHRAEQLLSTHTVPPLEPQQEQELGHILATAENQLCDAPQ